MVLYVGEGTPKMDSFINEQDLFYRYELKDIKELSCEELMNSSRLEDKILAVLCNVENPEHYFEQLIQELLGLPEKERTDYIRKLLTAVYYRPKLKVMLKRILEDRRMPLTIAEEMIRQDPFYQEGLERGKLEAKKEDAKRLYVELKLPAEQIARILNIPLDVVREVIKEVK